MKSRSSHPNWRSLYLLVVLVLAAFYFEAKAPLTENGHRMAEMAILLPGFGLIYFWLSLNEAGLMAEDNEIQRQMQHQSLKQILERSKMGTPTRTHNERPPRTIQTWLVDVFSVISGYFHF